MSKHHAKVEWCNDGGSFSYDSYSRDHRWTFANGQIIEASAAPSFLGDEGRIDPEEAYVASLSSCHMLTFLAIAARKRLVVESYSDEAVGTLEENDEGKMAVTEVVLRPRVCFSSETSPNPRALEKMHEAAHQQCFIANSVRTGIRIESVQS